jgi:hypothetical protein
MIVDPKAVLEGALEVEDFEKVAVVGLKNGEFYVASSHPFDEMVELMDDGIEAVSTEENLMDEGLDD